MKRVLAMLLTVAMLLTLLPAGAVSASGGALSLAQLREKYPHGAYWNHTGTTNKAGSYTWNPCTHHTGNCDYGGGCGCNSYNGVAIQCMGFAYQLASLAYDCDPRREWGNNTGTTALNTLKPGDIVRYKNNSHSIFVIGVEGDTVTYADCNSDRRCKIKWDQTTTKAALKATFTYVKSAPYALEDGVSATATLTIRYHAGGGTIAGAVIGDRYTVTDPDGVNLRSGAGTGNPVLTALPKGTVFTVKTGNTKKAGGYTWGKTTYNGTTGWLVISDFVEKTGTLREGDYYLSESLVHRADSGEAVTRTAAYGDRVTLDDPATFGLTMDGRQFVGWSTQKTGTPLYAWDDTALKAETLYPALSEGSTTVTLYAVWACAHRYEPACAATCTLCGAQREAAHVYDTACDPDCNLCGAVRQVSHSYAAACTENCALCGAERQVTHTFVDNTCTVCGRTMVPLTITAQPKTGYARMGETVQVTVEAQGEGLTYQWLFKSKGMTKYAKSSNKTATYTTTMSTASKDRRVLCYVYDKYGNRVQSKTVVLREQVSVVTQPKLATYAKLGEVARVTVAASGDDLTYQWYLRSATGTKYSRSSITSATYSVRMSEKVHGRRLYCVVKDRYGKTVKTQTVILRRAASITAQPETVTVAKGETATVMVEAVGDGLTYTWYFKNPGKKTFSKSSVKTATYATKMTAASKERQVYCVVKDKYGNTVRTNTVTLRMT